jgi:membrane-bound lytic murein transglycosylase B
MGQSQFMPSSFLAFAVDYDHDGRRDIWGTRADVFASIANYLSQSGWHGDQTWGREIRLPARFDQGLLGLDTRRTLADWRQLGVRRSDGGELPARDIEASIVLGGKDHGPPHLVYDNFRTIMKWNRSYFFAGAVGRLADEIDGQ